MPGRLTRMFKARDVSESIGRPPAVVMAIARDPLPMHRFAVVATLAEARAEIAQLRAAQPASGSNR